MGCNLNRRNFIKSLTLIPAVIGAGKITFEQHLGSINYKDYFYGGNAGGGKTERLFHIISHYSYPTLKDLQNMTNAKLIKLERVPL